MSNVGYRRPPRHTQFRPGQSGNPGGRPRKLPTLQNDLRAELAETILFTEDDRDLTVSKQRALVKRLVTAALKGDSKAATAVIALARMESGQGEGDDSDDLDRDLLETHIEEEVQRRLLISGGKHETES